MIVATLYPASLNFRRPSEIEVAESLLDGSAAKIAKRSNGSFGGTRGGRGSGAAAVTIPRKMSRLASASGQAIVPALPLP